MRAAAGSNIFGIWSRPVVRWANVRLTALRPAATPASRVGTSMHTGAYLHTAQGRTSTTHIVMQCRSSTMQILTTLSAAAAQLMVNPSLRLELQGAAMLVHGRRIPPHPVHTNVLAHRSLRCRFAGIHRVHVTAVEARQLVAGRIQCQCQHFISRQPICSKNLHFAMPGSTHVRWADECAFHCRRDEVIDGLFDSPTPADPPSLQSPPHLADCQ